MADRKEDKRGKKIIFVSSCLMNTNNKVCGLARYSGMCRDVFDTLCDNGLGIQQMDCPETLYLGINRWWQTKNLYDCRGFRDHCRQLAERVVTYMEEYARVGYKVVAILSCDGSPTCGVTITSYDPNWGGSPVDLNYNDAIIQGKGVYIEELEAIALILSIVPELQTLPGDNRSQGTVTLGHLEDHIKRSVFRNHRIRRYNGVFFIAGGSFGIFITNRS